VAGVAAALALSGLGRRLAGPVAAASLFFLAPWIGIQISVERAARRHFDAIESEPKLEPAVEAPYHCVMGDRCSNLRQLDLAARAYGRALSVCPRYEYAWRLGMVYLASGRYAESARAMEKALQMAPDDLRAMMQLGEALTASRDFARATAVLDRAIQLNPRSGGALLRRALVEVGQGRTDEARRWLARADSLSAPDDPARGDLRTWQARLAVTAPGSSTAPAGSGPDGRPPSPPADPVAPVHGSN
jgi:tetratricopeptide (TPR) repeat protein